ncbi:type II CRISPR-associated endonuclease Cas1 [Calycomorphotria hydatis]|uniref:CRISPR-associated endonuclease Cas1 n=1 Tax=Calycomorphotria hydatis TaxID=2528027 RepID=A0A517TA73_9PLAN|nr:type II CRISPR-associated endonuclease Cas1 [Calycomorphotria hydatis]QDT65271.1 CRISPR-associated endonuclease Cas1 [Calycomorphotria hydatis]
MQNRILDIAEQPARLALRGGLLELKSGERAPFRVRPEEVGVVLLAHPQISITQPVLSALTAAGGVLLTCDERRMPAGMMLPVDGHFTQTERFAKQAATKLPLRKRLWQQIVRAKIRGQAEVLEEIFGEDAGIRALIPQVGSGDPRNVEARAARKYWPLLFNDDGFRRDRDRNDQNRLLNYGYAVLRAITARAICAVGLHPSVGLHHKNRYNAFCLADDLMEPFRPVVDLVVARHVEGGGDTELNSQSRQLLIGSLLGRCIVEGKQLTLFDSLAELSSSLVRVIDAGSGSLTLPERLWHASGQPD